jgi:hypothetical protein
MAAGQQPGQRGQDGAVGPGQLRRSALALEYGDLVAQEEDLGVLGPVGAGEQGKPVGCQKSAIHCELDVRVRPSKDHGVRLNSFTELAQQLERVRKQRKSFIALPVKSQLTACDSILESYR